MTTYLSWASRRERSKFFEKVCKWHCVNVRSKEVVDGLFLIACIGLRTDCLHKRCFVLTVIT